MTLDVLLDPAAVVVVGASRDAHKLGGVMPTMLGGYDAPVLLVNPRGGEGFHTDVAAAAAATDRLDLAVLCVPAVACADAVRDAAAAGVGAVLVCAGGFAEAGGVGVEHERRLAEAVAETGVRLLGPNTSGFFVPRTGLLASFVPGVQQLEHGGVAVVAASGGVNHALAFALQRAEVGISIGIGIGAGLDVGAVEVLEHLATDDATRAVALHLETVSDGPGLLRAVRELTKVKPVVALVVGQHDVAEFARSHTGALATSWRTTRALLRQAGAVLVDDETELVTVASALAVTRLAPHIDPGVGLVTAQAGPGLLVADHLAGAGVRTPRLADRTRARLAELLPPLTYQANPVDTGRPGPTHSEVVSAVAADPKIDLVAVYALTEPVVDLPAAVAAAAAPAVVVGLDGPADEVALGRLTARKEGLALAVGATPLARAVVGLVDDARLRHRLDADRPTTASAPVLGDGPWHEAAGKDLLDILGVPTPRRRLCDHREAAHDALEDLGRVVVKVCDATIVHKSDVGGVHVGIADHAALDAALDDLARFEAPVLVEELAPSGLDLVVGARRDPVFGPTVLLGLGGTATEVLADVAIAGYPAGRGWLARLPDQLAARALLEGHRGGPVADVDRLAEVLDLLGALLLANPHLEEVEINPLRITAAGLLALDVVLLASSGTERP